MLIMYHCYICGLLYAQSLNKLAAQILTLTTQAVDKLQLLCKGKEGAVAPGLGAVTASVRSQSKVCELFGFVLVASACQ